MSDAEVTNLLDAALKCGNRGWRVLPLHSIGSGGICDCGRSNCSSPGKHPRTPHGQSDATDDANQIREWWTLWPNANVGVVCRPSGIVVLDVDPRNGGDETLAALIEKFGALPATLTADTGGGGQHYVFQHPGVKLPAHAGRGLDIKDDGYIVVAPSLHASGKQYTWRDADASVADMPNWLVDLGQATPSGTGVADGKITQNRNDTLTSLAGLMRAKGMSPQAIEAALLADNDARCQPPLGEDEVRDIAKGILRYPAGSSEAGSTSAAGLSTLQWSELVNRSYEDPPKELVRGLLSVDSTLLIYGYAGVGKSLFALELGLAVHRGEPFLGTMVTQRARVGVLDEESAPRQLGQRLTLLALGHDVDPRDPDLPCFSVGNGARLDTPDGLDAICDWVTENKVEVVVCDTQRRLTPGLKENESDDMAILARNVAELRRRTGVTVILLHHARKGAKDTDPAMMARGSGDILAAVDGALYLERRKTGTTGATHAKARWAEPIEPFAFRITQTETGGIRLVAVAEAINEKSTKTQGAKVAMLLALAAAPDKTLSRVLILTVGTSTGASESTAENALNELVAEGKVSRRKDGRESIFTLTSKGELPF